jgi:chromosome segregation ATPase
MDSTSPKWPGVEAGVQVRPRLRRAMFPPRAKRPTRHETNETRGVISGTPRCRTATRGVYARACPRIPIAVSTIGTERSPASSRRALGTLPRTSPYRRRLRKTHLVSYRKPKPSTETETQAIRHAAGVLFDRGFKQRSSIAPLVARLTRREGELRRARADILELQGLREQDAEEMEGVREDAAVSKAGFDEERETREKAEADRDEAHRQLEFLEGELEGVRASERALIEENKTLQVDLTTTTSSRDEFEAESRRVKDLNAALDVEASGLRAQLAELREKHAAALDDARRYRADAERQGERAGKLAAQTSAAMSEADKLRKWQDWAKSSEVTSLKSELETAKQERDMLTRDLQSRLAETRRVTAQNEEWGRDVKALRADLFAREGRLGRVEAELASVQRHAQKLETDLSVAKEQIARRQEELQVASMDGVRMRGKFETEKLKNQALVNSIRSQQYTETAELKTAHAHELEAARRDAAAAWRLAKELETRVLSQAKTAASNTLKFSNAMAIGRRLTGEDPKPPGTPLDLT